jgi:hypothetical protein
MMIATLASNVEVYSLFSIKDFHDYGKVKRQWSIYIFPITKELFPLRHVPDYVDLQLTIRNLITDQQIKLLHCDKI